MWTLLVANSGKLKYEAEGTDIYANPDATYDPDPGKTKAVRKIVRLIIEKEGGITSSKKTSSRITKEDTLSTKNSV